MDPHLADPDVAEIEALASFITEFSWLSEAHGARFFTRGLDQLIPPDWYPALLQLSETQLYLLPCLYETVFKDTSIIPPPSLHSFLAKCRSFAMRTTPEQDPLGNFDPSSNQGSPDHSTSIPTLSQSPLRHALTKCMSPKKRHEVERLADLIYRVAMAHGCHSILDLGCGQGYLMQILSFYYKLDVLGVDSSELQTIGAIKRAEQQQILLRSYFQKNPSIDQTAINLTPVFLTLVCPVDTKITMAQLSQRVSAEINSPSTPTNNPQPVPKYPKKTQPIPFQRPTIHPLLSERGVLLVGLHTCGDLAPTTLRLFHESPTVKAMINVGCCYNLMTETKGLPSAADSIVSAMPASDPSSCTPSLSCTASPPHTLNANPLPSQDKDHTFHLGGYPLSTVCKRVLPNLSRTARVLACQSVAKRPAHVVRSESGSPTVESDSPTSNRSKVRANVDDDEEEASLPIDLVHRSQVFRAVLQVIYEQHYNSYTNNYSGQYSSAYLDSFSKYATHILSRLNLGPILPAEKLEEIWNSVGKPSYHKVVVLDNLRVCMSPVIEALIMKDRIRFLHEQNKALGLNSQHALVPVFDASISPRNMAIISLK